MLSFDIETMGLDPRLHRITVAAICDRAAGIRTCYNFLSGGLETQEEFMQQLDRADSLCSFNGVAFDLPFIVKRFDVPPERYEPWFLKLFDYYHVAKTLFDSSFSLNLLLSHNGHNPKSGSGMQAVKWAREGEHEKLMEYCQDDADLTYDISVSHRVLLPLKNVPGGVYSNKAAGNHAITHFDGDV